MTQETVFHEALAKPRDERPAFLDQACAGRPELRAAVEALLAAHDQAGSFLKEAPPATSDYVPSDADDVALPGTTDYQPESGPGAIIAGRYTLVEKIGEGGMGEVWVAKQTEPVKRKVALKLIKAGMDTKAVLQRFEQERQALALMDHPNIARVLDGGMTPDRRPFFVMELVNGLPLTRFCDDAKLTPNDRLQLFVPICQAVQHAHQKGIVHRDLKPSNILVTLIDGKPAPKVIDFGVAKATAGKLTDESLSTHFGAVVGTLEYMSPEQAGYSGQDIDTRADIYSLGVILYELLTGLRPIDAKRLKKAALAEMIRIIQVEDPSRPSMRLSTDESLPSVAAVRQTDPKKLMALLRGELDWVVMKCLEKQRERRYETANALARDIQRYLADEPVEARPPSFGYRAGKFLPRHKGPVLAASLGLLTLVGGIIGTTWGLIDADRAWRAEASQRKVAESEKAKAEDREQQAIEAVKRFRDAVANNPELKNNPSLAPLRQTLLKEPLTFFKALRERLQSDNDTSEKSLRRLAGASFDLGLLSEQIGDKQDALAAFREALGLSQKLVDANLADIDLPISRAATYNCIGVLLTDTGKFAEAQKALEDALAIQQKLADANPTNHRLQQQLAKTHNNIGNLFQESGKMAAALKAYESAAAIRRKLASANPTVIECQSELATSLSNTGLLLSNIGKPVEAMKEFDSGRAILEELARANPNDSDLQHYLATIQLNIGTLLERTERPAQALAAFEASRTIYEQLAKAHPTISLYQHDLVTANEEIAKLLADMRKPAEALQAYQAAGAICRKLVDANPTVTDFQVLLASIYHNRGILLQNTGKPDEARKEYQTALAMQEMLARTHPDAPQLASHMGAFLNDLATLEMDAARFADARNRLHEAVQWQQKALDINPAHPTYRQFLGNHYRNLIDVCNALKDAEGATEAARQFNVLQAADPTHKAMDERLLAVAGGAPPKDNSERLKLAEHAATTSRFALAARLFAEALEADSMLAESGQEHVRFSAVCTAVLAAMGKGQPTAALDDTAKSKLRSQALRWLEAELESTDKQLASATDGQRSAIAETLQYWKVAPDLVGVRDERELAKLPDGERKLWLSLWSKVDALVAKARVARDKEQR